MHRPSRTVALVGTWVILSALASAGVAAAASPVGAPHSVVQDAAATPSPGSMAGMDGMDGMDGGSMPGMTHGPAAVPGHAATTAPQPGHDDMAGMPGMADNHPDAAAVSRPLAWVIGAFAVVNGLMMTAAGLLRRRRPARPVTRRPRAAAI